MKFDDTNVVPEAISAPWVKRFFKRKFGIPVRVENADAGPNEWVRVWIMSDRTARHTDPMRYSHRFPDDFCRRCMGIIYRGSPVGEQTWGGNIGAHSVAMSGREFRELLEGLLANPVQPAAFTAVPAAATI